MLSNLQMNRRNIVVYLSVIFAMAALFYMAQVHSMDRNTFLNFLFVTIVAACYPLKLGDVKRLNIFWLIIPILYLYDFVSMLLFYQVAITVFLLFGRTKEGNFARYPIYSFVFFVGPLLSYGVLTWCGFTFESLPFLQMFAVNCLFYFVFLFFSGIIFMVFKEKSSDASKSKEPALLEFVNSIIFVLFGTALYSFILMYGEVAIIGALLVYLMIASFSRHYDATKQKSATLENIMDLHMKFNGNVTKQQLTNDFLQRVMVITEAKQVLIVHEAEMYFVFKNNDLQKSYVKRCDHQMLQKIFAENRVHYIKKRAYLHIDNVSEIKGRVESFLALPMRDFEKPMMLLLESDNRFAFDKGKVELCKLLVMAYKNALQQQSFMQETINKSERCVLTGMYNYRYLTERIQDMEHQLAQQEMDCLSTIILDIDHFKQINDTYGHENGNLILKEFGARIQTLVDDNTILARYGGEEFVVLLPNVSTQNALEIAERYRQAIEQLSFQVEHYEQQVKKQVNIHVTVSIGVANFPEHTNNLSELITFADRALYVGAKQAGRNRVAVFQESMSN